MPVRQYNFRLPEDLIEHVDDIQAVNSHRFRNRTDMLIELIRKGIEIYTMPSDLPPDDLIAALQESLDRRAAAQFKQQPDQS